MLKRQRYRLGKKLHLLSAVMAGKSNLENGMYAYLQFIYFFYYAVHLLFIYLFIYLFADCTTERKRCYLGTQGGEGPEHFC